MPLVPAHDPNLTTPSAPNEAAATASPGAGAVIEPALLADVEYFLTQPGLFVLPIEHLTAAGVNARFAGEVVRRGLLTEGGVALFNRAMAAYWTRADDLFRRAPRSWFPPRIQHVCVVTEPLAVRPYFQPFHRNSWLLYATDFDPDDSHVEFAAFQILQAERMGLMRQIVPALSANLSYLLTLSEESVQAFASACERTRRPDAEGYRALAAALPAIRQCYHEDLRPPLIQIPLVAAASAPGLLAPEAAARSLVALQEAWGTAAVETATAYRRAHELSAGANGATVTAWLADSRPALLVTAGEDRILWEPGNAAWTAEVADVLAGASAIAEASILEDLKTVDVHTRRFLACLRAPEELVDPAPYITEGGLSYVHRTHKLVAYDLGAGENAHRLWEASPPYERLMLAARTTHEWGHLAAESGWIRVNPASKAERAKLLRQVARVFDQIYESGPMAVQAATAADVARLRAKSGTLGKALVRSIRQRIEDYMANLLAHRLLGPYEMDTYVRNNVASRAGEYQSKLVYHELARAAYEVQYLRLSRIELPMEWFFKSTWFIERFVETGIVTLPQFYELVTLLAQVCDLYEFDTDKLDLADHPARPLVRLDLTLYS